MKHYCQLQLLFFAHCTMQDQEGNWLFLLQTATDFLTEVRHPHHEKYIYLTAKHCLPCINRRLWVEVKYFIC